MPYCSRPSHSRSSSRSRARRRSGYDQDSYQDVYPRSRARRRSPAPHDYRADYRARYLPSPDFAHYDRNRDETHNKPITNRVGTGRNARIAVETGGTYASALDYARKEQLEKLEYEKARLARHAEREAKVKRQRRERTSPVRRPEPRIYEPPPEIQPDVPTVDDPEILRPISPATPYALAEYLNEEDYDFQFHLKPKAVTYSLIEDVSFSLSAESSTSDQKPSRSRFDGPVTNVPIMQSRWLGSASDRGDLSAEISTSEASPAQVEKDREPLMHWHHLERNMMSFEEFMAAAHGLLQVSEQKRRNVNKLLRDVQSKFEKQRQHGRNLEPNCVSDLFVGSSAKESSSVMFASFPYFALESHDMAQLRNLTPGTPMHPLRPLLQSHYYSTSQRREMAQAITKFGSTGNGKCLHVSQVWCLIVDRDTMITCSRQSHNTLCGSFVTKSKDSGLSKDTQIRVSLGNDGSWQVPVKDETSWPSFLSVFGESIATAVDGGTKPEFVANGGPITAANWPALLSAAHTRPVSIDLQQARLPSVEDSRFAASVPVADADTTDDVIAGGNPPQVSQHGTGPQQGLSVDSTMNAAPKDDRNKSFAIFHHSATSFAVLADDLDEVLRANTHRRENKAYENIPGSTYSTLAQHGRPATDTSKDSRLRLTGLAFYLFRFFWPCDFDHPLTSKYWGALESILKLNDDTYDNAEVDHVAGDLKDDIVPLVQNLMSEFSASTADFSPLPDSYSRAFLHLTMILVLLAQSAASYSLGVNNSTVKAHLDAVKQELSAGRRAISARLRKQSQVPDLEQLEICSPTSLLALVLSQVSRDVMHGAPDVASCYNDYYYQLEFRIAEDPTPRSHQETLRFFLQEVEAILATLRYQLSVIEGFEASVNQQQQPDHSTSSPSSAVENNAHSFPALGVSRQQMVLNDCKARIAARIAEFKGLQQRTEDLGEWHRNAMETNRDRQENAIMIFTIVTIVFLPLSFVSSVFGMNTSDVRDMPYSQWAYWAAGVPLTVLVVLGSLWWAGEFEGFGAWLRRATKGKRSTGRGYQGIPEPVGYRGKGRRYPVAEVYDDAPYPAYGVRERTMTYPRKRY